MTADKPSQLLLAGGIIVLYIASRAASEALARGAGAAPGRRAIAHWMPIAAVTLFALFMGRAEVAMAIIFSTSVACMSLVLGTILVLAPQSPAPTGPTRAWAFVLPTAVLVLLAGFAGRLNWLHALVLAAEGVVLVWLWHEHDDDLYSAPPLKPRFRIGTVLEVALAIMLAIIGAWAATRGAMRMSQQQGLEGTGILAAASLGPLLAIPIVLTGSHLVRSFQAWDATSVCVGVVLLNLCALLPIVILLWYPISAGGIMPLLSNVRTTLHAEAVPTTLDAPPPPLSILFPISLWRIDTVVLMLIGLGLVPVALGRWRPGKNEGLALIGFYAVYVLFSVVATRTQ